MAEEENEQKSYSFVRPGILQSRILNRERQAALGRGLSALIIGKQAEAQAQQPAASLLPRLEAALESAPRVEHEPRPTGVEQGALLSRLQGTHREHTAQSFSALFQAFSARGDDATPRDTAAAAPSQPTAEVSAFRVPPSPVGQSQIVTVAGRQFPLAHDFAIVLMDLSFIQPNPFVPLSRIDREGLDRLMGSVKAHGFLRPLTVMPSTLGNVIGDQTYWLISGERSWQVARLLGMQRVPVRIQDVAPREAIQMVLAEEWHLQRLPPMDRARLCGVLTEQMGMGVDEIAERLAIDRQRVEETLMLLELDPAIQDSLNNDHITEPAALALLQIEEPERREDIWKYAVKHRWGPTRIIRAVRDRQERQQQ